MRSGRAGSASTAVLGLAAAVLGLIGSVAFDTVIGADEPWIPSADATPVSPTSVPPSTSASPSTSTRSSGRSTVEGTSAPTPTDLGNGADRIGDLLDPVDRGAAIPDDRPARAAPTGLEISSLDVSTYPVREIGLEDDGQLEIPDETEIGWYRYGATAGREGATVLAAHVSWNGTIGPFFGLDTVEPGAQIDVSLDDGSTRRYAVTERALYEKQDLPRERIWRTTGPEELVLITCGGDFNPDIRRYRHNVVVYARPLR